MPERAGEQKINALQRTLENLRPCAMEGEWRRRYNSELYLLHNERKVTIYIKIEKLLWVSHKEHMDDKRVPTRPLKSTVEGKQQPEKHRNGWEELEQVIRWRTHSLHWKGQRRKLRQTKDRYRTSESLKESDYDITAEFYVFWGSSLGLLAARCIGSFLRCYQTTNFLATTNNSSLLLFSKGGYSLFNCSCSCAVNTQGILCFALLIMGFSKDQQLLQCCKTWSIRWISCLA